MSKYIPKSIINIGFTTKRKVSGSIGSEIDGNKVKKLNHIQLNALIEELNKVKNNLVKLHNVNDFRHRINDRQYEEILALIKAGSKLGAVKYFKETAKVGLKDAKNFIDLIS